MNIDGGIGIIVATALGVALGGSAASGIGLLLTLNIIVPFSSPRRTL